MKKLSVVCSTVFKTYQGLLDFFTLIIDSFPTLIRDSFPKTIYKNFHWKRMMADISIQEKQENENFIVFL